MNGIECLIYTNHMLSLLFVGSVFVIGGISFFWKREIFPVIVLIVCLFANLSSLVIYWIAPSLSSVDYVVALRELFIYAFLPLSFIFWKRLSLPIGHTIDRIYLVLLAFFAFMIGIGLLRNGLAALLMAREIIFPVSIYFLFRFISVGEQAAKRIATLVLSATSVIALFSIIEFIWVNVFWQSFWADIRISGYLIQKYGQFTGDYPLSWINYLPVFVGLPPTFRSITLLLDPLAGAHVLVCGFTLALYYLQGWKKYFIVGLIGLGVIMTFSKAGMLLCFLALGSQTFKISYTPLRWLFLGSIASVVVALGVLILSTGDDAFTHAGSFRVGVDTLLTTPLGHGIGSTGYFAYLVTGDRDVMAAVDTTFSVYVYQMGYLGLIALLLIIIYPAYYVFRYMIRERRRHKKISPLTIASLTLLGGYAFLSFSTAAAFTTVPITIPMILLALQVTKEIRETKAMRTSLPSYQPQPLLEGNAS